jgi:hypothetical protein
MTELSVWAKLDRARAAYEIEAAVGHPVFSQWSLLDRKLFAEELGAELGITVTPDMILNPASMVPLIDEALTELEEPDDDTPEWVPDDAKIHIDFVNDRAWTEADGEVAINTLVGADANADAGYGDTTGYTTEALEADGYSGSGDEPALIGAALTKLLAGATTVITHKNMTSVRNFYLLGSDGNSAIEIGIQDDLVAYGSSWSGSFDESIANIVNMGEGAINRVACTITPTRGELACNGSDAVSAVLDTDDFPISGESALVAAFIVVGGPDEHLQSITIYDPLPSTAGLSELSETGVTNTAPTLTGSDWPGFYTDTTPTSATIDTGSTAETPIPCCNLVAEDAEGNPLTITITDDEDGKFTIVPDGGDGFPQLRIVETLTAGTYAPVVRATDPGGLYVEQEFTITVTE